MWSVNQMFYGTDEPVWLVDGSSPAPVKYHYLGSAHRAASPPRRDYFDDGLMSDAYRHQASHRGLRSVHTPSYARHYSTMPYSSINPPPAPIVVPRETAISHTPVLPVMTPGMQSYTPYTLLLRVPICCEGCEKK